MIGFQWSLSGIKVLIGMSENIGERICGLVHWLNMTVKNIFQDSNLSKKVGL